MLLKDSLAILSGLTSLLRPDFVLVIPSFSVCLSTRLHLTLTLLVLLVSLFAPLLMNCSLLLSLRRKNHCKSTSLIRIPTCLFEQKEYCNSANTKHKERKISNREMNKTVSVVSNIGTKLLAYNNMPNSAL